jgi:hypothetical protein
MQMSAYFKRVSLFFLTKYENTIEEIKKRLLPFTRRLNGHSALALAGMLGPLILFIGDLVSSFSTPHYSMLRHSISSLALTSVGWLPTIGFLMLGLLIEVFAAGLLLNVKSVRWFYVGIACFVIFGFAMLLIGAFRTDPVGAVRTVEGRIHGLTATTTFSLFPVALLCFMPSIKRDGRWKDLYRYTGITFIFGVILLIIVRIFQEGVGWFGLAERLLVLNMIGWVEVTAVRLFFISLKRGVKLPEKVLEVENQQLVTNN